jgi:class 3 adenylate cyclase
MTIRNISDVESLLLGNPRVRDLYSMWEQRRPIGNSEHQKSPYHSSDDQARIPWLEDVSLAQRFTSLALQKEEFLLVFDAAREILRGWDDAGEGDRTRLVHVRRDYASVLARLGLTREARGQIEPCVIAGFQPELGRRLKIDIFLQLADILLEEWFFSTDPATRIKAAEDALDFGNRALQLDPGGLEALVRTASAAFVLELLGEDRRQQVEKTASDILASTKDLFDSEGPRHRTTWAEATALAVLRKPDEAWRTFERLKAMPGITTPQLATARFEAQFLAEALGKPRDFFKTAFPPLQLIVFAGHLPDKPGGRVRLPQESIPAVRDALRVQLRKMGARVGLVNASAGADLLFTECLRELQGTLHLVLPWSQDEFRRTSVQPYEPPDGKPVWGPLFDEAIKEAATTREIGHIYEPGADIGWEFTMEVTAGIALRTAQALRLDIQPMVFWDGLPGNGAGGTESFYSFWRNKLNIETVVVHPPAVSPGGAADASLRPAKGSERSILHQEVKSMLFADIVGYSKLTEVTIPEFIGTFLERLGRLCSTSKHAPCSVNTWGDAIYAVFDFARDAGLFALELAQMVEDGKPDWLAKGLYWESSENGEVVKKPLRIRIGLHTGPVVMHFDPVVRRIGFTGAHVNRAARIEPVTVPGQVFASEEFAAMTALSGEIQRLGATDAGRDLGFVCEYADSMQLAKGYPGRYRIYRVVPKRVFAIESLAKAAHSAYISESRARGETLATNSAMRPWDELSEDLREANRGQVADIPNKLRVLGWELAAGDGIRAADIALTDAQVEEMATREHDRWMAERKQHDWTYAPVRDNSRKHHPLLVPWDQLSEIEKEKDRDTIRNLPKLVEKAGFRVRRII